MASASNFRIFYKLLIALSLCFLCINPAAAQTGTHCSDDLMRLYSIHIPHAKLVSSETPATASQTLCQSVYQISGKFAHKAESLLIKKYGMAKLVFECCGWFPKSAKAGTFKQSHYIADRSYVSYQISMRSGETLEKNWSNIDYFYITLTIDAS